MARPFKVRRPYIPQVVFAQTILKKEILVRGKKTSLKKNSTPLLLNLCEYRIEFTVLFNL